TFDALPHAPLKTVYGDRATYETLLQPKQSVIHAEDGSSAFWTVEQLIDQILVVIALPFPHLRFYARLEFCRRQVLNILLDQDGTELQAFWQFVPSELYQLRRAQQENWIQFPCINPSANVLSLFRVE